MKKKRVLIIIDWFLPGTNSGGPVRSYANMIEHLEKEVDFMVITRDSDYCSSKKYDNIKIEKWNRLSTNLEVYYLDSQKLSYSKIKSAIKKVDFDVAIINGLYSLYFSISPLIILRKSAKKIIVSARGMLNPQAFSVKPKRKKIYLKLSNFAGNFKDIYFHATNNDEAIFLKNFLGSRKHVLIAPNFPRKINTNTNNIRVKNVNELRIVNVARVAEEKGTLRMIEYLRNFNSGHLILDIYGPIYDNEYWEKCKLAIGQSPTNVDINYKGVATSESIPQILQNYHLFIMLSEGENFGHSILEAMTCGLPVIISNLTPWTNLFNKNIGWDLPLKNKTEFVDAVQSFLDMDSIEYHKWSKAAENYANNFINDVSIYNLNARLLDL